MKAVKGQYIKVKEEVLTDYETRGYVDNLSGYEVTNLEPAGIFIKEFSYIILHGDYEIIEEHRQLREQEPILSKIRAEIEQERVGYPPSAGYYKAIIKCLKIIDKYKEESEE